jgi:hypothetical protein
MDATYLLDVRAGALRRLAANAGQPWAFVRPSGQLAIIRWDANVELIDLRSGERETVFARDPAAAQWATEARRLGDSGNLHGSFDAIWVGEDTFVLAESLFDSGLDLRAWGKVMRVDISAKHVHVLAEHGYLAAVFPDGILLVRQGWMDGALQLFTPNTNLAPSQVTPGGHWTDSWTVSPDGRKVAWLEWNPPRGDWSDRLPHDCCSGDPHPTIRDIVVWDRRDGRLQSFSATGVEWRHGILRWRRNSDALLFSSSDSDANHSALLQVTLTGEQTTLVQHPWYGWIEVYFEEANGTLYYGISGRDSQNDGQLIRRYSNGKLEELVDMDFGDSHPVIWSADQQGHIRFLEKDRIVVKNMVTGQIIEPSEERDPSRSPDGQWSIKGIPGPTIRIVQAK